MFLVVRLVNCALYHFCNFGWTIMLCCEYCHLVPIHRKMEHLDVFVGGLSVLLVGFHLVHCFPKDRTMRKAHVVRISGKKKIIGQALAILFSIIKGVGRVGPTTGPAQTHFQHQLRPKAGQYVSAIDPRQCISRIDPA